jgi:hypothetical protein
MGACAFPLRCSTIMFEAPHRHINEGLGKVLFDTVRHILKALTQSRHSQDLLTITSSIISEEVVSSRFSFNIFLLEHIMGIDEICVI